MPRRARRSAAAASVSPTSSVTKKVPVALGAPRLGAERRGFGQDAAQMAVFIDQAGDHSPPARAYASGPESEGRQARAVATPTSPPPLGEGSPSTSRPEPHLFELARDPGAA